MLSKRMPFYILSPAVLTRPSLIVVSTDEKVTYVGTSYDCAGCLSLITIATTDNDENLGHSPRPTLFLSTFAILLKCTDLYKSH